MSTGCPEGVQRVFISISIFDFRFSISIFDIRFSIFDFDFRFRFSISILLDFHGFGSDFVQRVSRGCPEGVHRVSRGCPFRFWFRISILDFRFRFSIFDFRILISSIDFDFRFRFFDFDFIGFSWFWIRFCPEGVQRVSAGCPEGVQRMSISIFDFRFSIFDFRFSIFDFDFRFGFSISFSDFDFIGFSWFWTGFCPEGVHRVSRGCPEGVHFDFGFDFRFRFLISISISISFYDFDFLGFSWFWTGFCPEGVQRVSTGCPEGVQRVSISISIFDFLFRFSIIDFSISIFDFVFRFRFSRIFMVLDRILSRGCPEGVWRVSTGCPEGVQRVSISISIFDIRFSIYDF